ncbi:MAG: polysaccharide deacetylase family protein, partial [Patescibacteria group bacterium]|nr:hypothetical protein [Patescibacteria group bacterium]
MFFFVPKAHAATYYVKWDAAGAADGTSWTDAYTTIQAALTARTTAGTVIEISGGSSGHTYTENLDTKADNITIQGSSASGHNGEVIIDGSGAADYTLNQTHITTLSRLTLVGSQTGSYNWRCVKTVTATDVTSKDGASGIAIAATNTITVTLNRFTAKDHTVFGINATNPNATLIINYGLVSGNQRNYFTAGQNATFNNVTFPTQDRYAIQSATGSHNIYLKNSILSGSGLDAMTYATIDHTGSGTCSAAYSVLFPNPQNPNVTNWVGLTDGGGNLYTSPKFSSPKRPAVVVLGVDDKNNSDYFYAVADKAKDRGFQATFFLHTIGMTSSDWTTLKSYFDQGHDVVPHSRTHSDLSDLSGLNIQYTGGGKTTATVTIEDTDSDGYADSLTTSLDSIADQNIDLTDSSYDTLSELANRINNLASYSASLTHASSYNDGAKSKCLADVSAQDINAADYHAQLNQTRYFDYEIAGSIEDIESNLSTTVTASSYPYNQWDSDTTTYLKNNNINGARTGPSGYTDMSDIDVYDVQGQVMGGTIMPMTNVSRNTAGFCEYLNLLGEIIVFYSHNTSQFTYDNWDNLLDALVNCNVQVKTFSQAVAYIRANGTLNGGTQRYERAFSDSSDYSLQYDSPLIDTGTDLGLTTDYAGNPIYGTPDIGAYEYQPPYAMGSNHPDTDADVRIY